MPTMAKEKRKSGDPSSYSYRPKPDVRKALREYVDSLEFETPVTNVIDRAVREFLREKGFDLPEKPDSDD